jgi:RNA polymerase sigma factor (sigma-70 family)
LVHQTQSDAESDAALLARFARLRDEQAFAELMRRHGPMVLAVASRMLRQRQDAEDVLQAVFLTLASRARSLRRVRSVAGWLHNVAVRISLNWLKMNRRREAGLRRLQEDRSEPAPNEPRELLDEELAQLPARLKETLVLRDLEGYSRSEVARKLGVPPGTVDSRLSYGRKRLRERLVRRGVTVGTSGVAAALASCAGANQVLPAALCVETFRLAELFVLGTTVSGVAAVTKITSLAQGELNRMFLTKISTTVGIAALAAALALGVSPASKVVGLASPVRANIIFVDDFNDGNVTDGSPVSWLLGGQLNGTGQVVAGDFVLSGTEISAFPSDSPLIRDGSLRTQFRFLQSTNSTVAYIFSHSPSAFASYIGVMRQDGLIAIAETSGPPYQLQIHSETATSLDPKVRDVVLQFDTFRSKLSLTAWHAGDPKPNQPQLVVFDDTLTVGEFGFGIDVDARAGIPGHAQVAFRNFAAVPEPSTVAMGSVAGAALVSFAFRSRLRRVDCAR